MIRRMAIATVLSVALAGGGVGLLAQETRSATLLTTEHYLDWERVSDAQISPDGSRIVYTRQAVNKLEDKWESSLWIMNADGSQHRFLVKGTGARWSPDGKRLMFSADGEPKGAQLFVRWIDAEGPATQITHVGEAPRNAKWSPDGKSVAFSMFVPDTEHWSISMPAEPKGAKWTPAPRVVSTLHYRQDQVGYLDDGFTHVFVVPAEGGTPRQVTSGKWSVGSGELRGGASIDWTPDSKSIVFEGNRSPDADLQYESSQLYVADVATGAIRDLVAKPGAWGRPVVSPDGRTVAFTGHAPTGRSHDVSDLFVIPITGGGDGMRKISGDYDRDPINLRWAPDGTGLYFDADDHGARNLQFATIVGGVKPVTSGRQVLTFDSVSKDLHRRRHLRRPRSSAGCRQSQSEAAGPGDEADRRQRRCAARQTAREVGRDQLQVDRQRQDSGLDRQAAVVRRIEEVSADSRDPRRAVLRCTTSAFNYMFQNFAANGFVVLFVNPRGSTGYGSDPSPTESITTIPGRTTTI